MRLSLVLIAGLLTLDATLGILRFYTITQNFSKIKLLKCVPLLHVFGRILLKLKIYIREHIYVLVHN